MAFPYRRILSPIDFDDNSVAALETAGQIARREDGVVLALHIVPTVMAPTGMPVYVDLYKGQEEAAQDKLKELARRHLAGVKYELLTHRGDPANAIVQAQRKLRADLIVLSTHARRGVSRLLLGSVAEAVLREANCPVLTVRQAMPDRSLVGHWMTQNPVTTSPEEKLDSVQRRMNEGRFRSMPVLSEGKLVGIVTDRDLRAHVGYLDHTEVKLAMNTDLLTVTPSTSIHDAARLLRERKIGALPVLEDGSMVGIVSSSDILQAFIEGD